MLDSKETIESVKFAVAFWKDCFDEGGMSWDDSGNNRAFLVQHDQFDQLNGASIYLLAKAKPDTYHDDKGKPMKDDIFHTALPKGPAGQFSYHLPFSNLLPTYGKNQKAAKDFLRWFHSKEMSTRRGSPRSRAFRPAPPRCGMDDKVWKVDPVMAPFRTAAESGHFAGYAGVFRPSRCRGHQQIHHRRHVRQSGPGHGSGRSRQMGPRGNGEDLCLGRIGAPVKAGAPSTLRRADQRPWSR